MTDTREDIKISDSVSVHSLNDSELQVLWALDQLTSSSQDRFTAAEIAHHLVEVCDVPISRQGVTAALQKMTRECNKNKKGYKLMEPGRKKLTDLNAGVVYIESGKPFSAKKLQLKEIFSGMKGSIYISDPYIDLYTLDLVFANIDKSKSIKILTATLNDKPKGAFQRQLDELRLEGYKVEIGVYSNSELHDRYIMDDDSFWLSGNSLNHLGNKESFLIQLGKDIRQSMLGTFISRWKVSQKI